MKIKKEAIILKKRQSVFDIVNNVNLYKNFVPYCVDSKIISEEENLMKAKLDFDVRGIKTSFTTKNIIKRNESIQMVLIEGPFKQLDGEWRFKEVDNKTIIELSLNYEIKKQNNRLCFGEVIRKNIRYSC